MNSSADCNEKVGRTVEDQFKTLKADWRYVSGGRWELTFLVGNDLPVAVKAEGSSSEKKPVRRKHTDVFVDGLESL